MNTEYYYKPTHLTGIVGEQHLQEAKEATYNSFVLEKHTGKTPSTIQAKTSFENSRFVYDLSKKFGSVRTHYLKFDPMTCYNWHTDIARKCSINFLLNDPADSLTLFRQPIPNSTLWYNIQQLKYDLFQPTLLNVRESHCVLNYSQETRYVLTIGFTLDVTYADVKDFLLFYKT